MELATDCKYYTGKGRCSHPISGHPGKAACVGYGECYAYERRETMQKFWMLLVDGATYPTRRHLNVSEAREEAGRLLNLRENWGKGITLLEAVDQGRLGYTPVTYPVTWEHRRDDIFVTGDEFPDED